jgi:AraC-like DNA-binding protein
MKSVPRSDVPQSPFLWTRGNAARETLRYLDRSGIDAEPLLVKAELSRGQLSQDSDGTSVVSECRFLELGALATNDPLLGLHVAAEIDLRNFGILFYLGASSATVAEALEHLTRYSGTGNEANRFEISRNKDETVLTNRPALAFDEPRRQLAEFGALAVIRALGRVTNRDFPPSHITFAHTRNSGLREIHRILRCPVEFGCAADSWVLPQSVIELPIVSKDSHLLRILETHADDLLSQRHAATGLRALVESQLASALPSGRVQAAVVAQQLGMSERSFRRRLAEEGTTFSEILDQLRNSLALRYLEDQRISLQQIAWVLGYSELAAFNHAFKRWFGTSPRLARNPPAAPAVARQDSPSHLP